MTKNKKIEKNADYSVCLMGASLNTGNMGVSALAASLIKIIKEVKPDADIALFIGNSSSKPQELKISHGKKIQIKIINYRLSPKAKINEHLLWIFMMACIQKIMPFNSIKKLIINSNSFLKAMFNADFVGDIRGGDSFSDIYGLNRLFIGSIPAIIALLFKKKLVLLPQTYGPYNSNIGKYIAKLIMSKSAHILSRDRQGIETIRQFIDNRTLEKDVTFCPDVAFMLNSITPARIDIQPPIDLNLNVPLIGLNVNGLLYNL